MNLRDLEYLVAVSELKHFGRAADKCFVSQPALSMQLKKLEETLGVELFERSNKKVMVTKVGQEIADRAAKILRDANEIKDLAKTYHDPFAGDLRMGAFPTLAPYLLPQIVPDIVSEYPNLKLLLIEEKTDALVKMLREGEIDVALLALPIDVDSLDSIELFQDDFLLALPPSHHLAKRKYITHQDLQSESLLLLEEGHCLREQALDVCSLIGTSESQDFRATSLETLRQMVASGVGITLIPESAKKENDGIVYLPFKSQPLSRRIALVFRKTSPKLKLCHGIAEMIAR